MSENNWRRYLRGDPIPWLLEPGNPSVRYFTLTEILERDETEAEVVKARKAIMVSKPVREILNTQYPEGYWMKPGRGYSPKYKATLWQLIFLAQLGATRNEAIERACEHALEHAYNSDLGLFSAHKHTTGAIACLNGNLLYVYTHFGYGHHPRIERLAEALAKRITDDGFRCRYNSASTARPATWLPCAWGAVKVLNAFAQWPEGERTPQIEAAIEQGATLLLSRDLTVADYPNARGVSALWFQLGFPLGFTSDILEVLDVLTKLGYRGDERLRGAIEWVLAKGDESGRWTLERTLDRMWTRLESKGQPSKWVTLRVLRVLRQLHPERPGGKD